MRKYWLLACSGLLTVGLAGAIPTLDEGSADDPPPPEKRDEPAKKGEPGPEGDLRRAYELLRRVKAEDGLNGRADDRLRDWTARGVGIYKRGVQAFADGDRRRAHELGVAAHDLARAVDHAKNAARLDRADDDLPPPPPVAGPAGGGAQARRDLRHAYDRIGETDDDDNDDKEARFYLDGARDLYTAARRDAEDGRVERAAELAKAAEALTHVPEHLARADGAVAPPEPEPKAKAKKKGDGPEPKAKKKGDGPEPKTRKKADDGPEPKAKKKGDGPEPKAKKKADDGPDEEDGELPPPLKPRA